jgi:iron complex outermembrane recepter protein
VSVSVISGEKLADVAITRIEEMSAYVPNLTLSETAIGTQLFVRGIGSGINQGFEQSVGTYVDGVYYGRAQLTRSPFFDMERVEVLRGPQMTLFGNSSIGGALSLNTTKPSDEVEASISVLYEPENNEKEYIVIGNTPIADKINARVAYRKYDFGGYVENVYLGEDGPNRNFDTARVSFTFEPTDTLTTALKLEHSSFDTTGRQISIFGGDANRYAKGTNPTISFSGRNETIVRGNTLAEIYNNPYFTGDSAPDALQISPDGSTRYSNGEYSENTSNNLTLSATLSLENGYEINGIMSYLAYEFDENCDCDFSGLEILNYSTAEDYQQKRFELRFASPGGETFDFTGGFYFHEDKLSYDDELIVPEEDNPIAQIIRGIFGPTLASIIKDIRIPRTFDQDGSQKAVFGQMTWNMRDDLRLIAGFRRSHYKKAATRKMIYTDLAGVTFTHTDTRPREIPGRPDYEAPFLSVYDTIFSALFGTYRHHEQGVQDRYKNAFNLIVEWDITDSYMLYASKSNGFKAGGFDVRSNAPTSEEGFLDDVNTRLLVPGSFEFSDEQVKSYELGLKTRPTDFIEVNAAYFYTEIEDLQVSTFDGAVGFNVGNAGKARTQGLELEIRAALTENLLLTASIATLDFKYLEYEDGPCITSDALIVQNTSDEKLQRNCEKGLAIVGDPDAKKGFFSDMAGETTLYAADYSGLLSLNYKRQVQCSFEFSGYRRHLERGNTRTKRDR